MSVNLGVVQRCAPHQSQRRRGLDAHVLSLLTSAWYCAAIQDKGGGETHGMAVQGTGQGADGNGKRGSHTRLWHATGSSVAHHSTALHTATRRRPPSGRARVCCRTQSGMIYASTPASGEHLPRQKTEACTASQQLRVALRARKG